MLNFATMIVIGKFFMMFYIQDLNDIWILKLKMLYFSILAFILLWRVHWKRLFFRIDRRY